MKKFCKDVKEHAIKIIDYEKKHMKPETMKQMKKINHIINKKFVIYAIKI